VLVHCVLGPRKFPPFATHCCWVMIAQLGVFGEGAGKQHAPCGAQEVLVQSEFGPRKIPPFAAHCCWVMTAQLGVPGVVDGMQHAPCGGAQEVLVHGMPTPRNVPPAALQLDWVVIPHPPLGLQHAPVLAPPQFAELHDTPDPWNTPFSAAHWLCVTIWHEMLVGDTMQHAPSGLAQLTVLHEEPGP
jgi:hypothetical protein